jgi:nitroreductase
MSIEQILQQRSSCRSFSKEAVDSELLQKIFSAAQQSPSNCSVLPWQVLVVSGKKKDELKK